MDWIGVCLGKFATFARFAAQYLLFVGNFAKCGNGESFAPTQANRAFNGRRRRKVGILEGGVEPGAQSFAEFVEKFKPKRQFDWEGGGGKSACSSRKKRK